MMRPRIIGEYFENSAMSHKLMFSAKDFMYTESENRPSPDLSQREKDFLPFPESGRGQARAGSTYEKLLRSESKK